MVATPIGTARDITLRALDILASADMLVAEDTRSLKKLMGIHGIPLGDRPVWSYHDHSGAGTRDKLVEAVRQGRSVAYASEAGTPMVSDPGFDLARAMIGAGLPLTGAPGPSAAIAALLLSGLPTDRFLFLGFLPPKTTARKKALAEVSQVQASLVLYESPKRLNALLADMRDILGTSREAALCRELTKRFEEVLRAPLGDLTRALEDRTVKGECVVVVGPPVTGQWTEEDMRNALIEALKTQTVRDAAALVSAQYGMPRKAVYQMGAVA